MPYELYSQRGAARQKDKIDDVYQYDELPSQLRTQIDHILTEVLGDFRFNHFDSSWERVYRKYIKEAGLERLANGHSSHRDQFTAYLQKSSTGEVLDFVDLVFNYFDTTLRGQFLSDAHDHGIEDIDAALKELNHRFKQHAVGYEFVSGQLIRIDSRLIHAEAIRPSIQLLHDAGQDFSGPLQEFLDAHRKYREGEHKDAIVSACRSFESVMKSICTLRGWTFDPAKDTASKLIEIVFAHGLIPPYMQQHFTGLRTCLEAGVPTARNKTAGHGQGPVPIVIPDHFVAYVLHLTASNIVLLIESHRAMP